MSRCTVFLDPACAGHDNPTHPECHARLLQAVSGIPAGTESRISEPATPDQVHRIHSPLYTEHLRQRCLETTGISWLDGDTYITRASYEAALHAAGGAIAATREALNGRHAFAFVRPPGHHAEHARAMGFCLLNNTAIAAADALQSVDRVAVVDWDVHHGNGTQNSFYLSNRMLYCSVHQDNHFPFTGAVDEIGNGTGKGFTVNAPLEAGSAGSDIALVISEIFLPVLERFRPDCLIVTAGQDILFDDPLGGLGAFPDDFPVFTSLLLGTGCPLALVLEGGYGPSHGEAVAGIFAALEKPVDLPGPGAVRDSTKKLISLLRKVHHIP